MDTLVNDIHSELNASEMAEIVDVDSLGAVQDALGRASERAIPVAIAGGRHAMGGQQFCNGGLLIDTRQLARVLHVDLEHGLAEVEAGIHWRDLIDHLHRCQEGDARPWAIAQKQTGADRLSIGGAVSANAHGRGLALRPFVSDVESLTLVMADGNVVECSRSRNEGLFRLVAGGYGLLGCIHAVTLRLVPRRLLERVVEIEMIDDLGARFEERISDGFLYGDFQFVTDETSDDFLRRGVFACYRPIEGESPPPEGQLGLSSNDWTALIALAHTDKRRAFELYSGHYLQTSGQVYYSDRHQLADYQDGYHRHLDGRLGSPHPATEMISELYVPRDRLAEFMGAVADDFRAHGVDLIYGTVRLIERDDESFLAWATDRWACVIFNLHTVHTPDGIAHSTAAFRRLIDLAIDRGGKYFLTYHRWATREQIETCYPQIREFLRRKLEHDPDERFQSDWYRHTRDLLGA